MDHQKSVFVIMPVYNEAEVLEQTLGHLVKQPYEVVVVNDGSTDQTAEVMRRFPVRRLYHEINLGQGAAIQTGMDYALKQGAEIVVHFDADGQHRSEDIPTLIEPILQGDVEAALGSRFLMADSQAEVPFLRRLFLKVATVVNYFMTGVQLSDAHNGLRALSKKAASKIHLYENGYSHASEIIQQLKKHKIKFREYSVRIRYTKYSRGKQQSFWNGFNILIDMILRGIFK